MVNMKLFSISLSINILRDDSYRIGDSLNISKSLRSFLLYPEFQNSNVNQDYSLVKYYKVYVVQDHSVNS